MNERPPLFHPSPEALRRVRELAERDLTVVEFNAYVDAPMSDQEREGILESVEWFTRRYPTPGERLSAARKAYSQWVRGMAAPPSRKG